MRILVCCLCFFSLSLQVFAQSDHPGKEVGMFSKTVYSFKTVDKLELKADVYRNAGRTPCELTPAAVLKLSR